MAIFYMNVQIIGRSAGRTATGAAAYRSGERIVDERTGQIFDYTRRRGEIEAQIFAPAGSPAWVQERGQLWNAAEKAERRADAQVAREISVAFPKELSREEQRELIADYVREQFVARGMVVDVAIHLNPGNPHAHIMLTMREMGPDGFASKKNREWNKPEMLEIWRERWSAHANRALERAGREERIDHRSLAEQGSERLPQVHLGPHAAALERQGISTEKGDHNRLVAEHNAVVVDLERARETRRRLKAAKTVDDRYRARLSVGWHPDHAEALGRLEYERDGRQLSYRDLLDLHTKAGIQLEEMRVEIHAIPSEAYRLDRVAEALSYRQMAAEEVKRLESPTARVKRWFSDSARREYALARDLLQRHDDRVRELGTTNEEELKNQRAHWAGRSAKMPVLEKKATELEQILKQVSRAREGFEQEHEREQALRRRALQREQNRGR